VCGQHIEVFQRISEEPLTTCGVCGGPLRKVFHPAGIVFKGSGFYATDSRSGKSGAGAKGAETTSGPEGASTSDAGSSSSKGSTDTAKTAESGAS